MEEITLETILTALGELKEITENKDSGLDDITKENIQEITYKVADICVAVSDSEDHLMNIEKSITNIEKIAEHAFVLCLALITITVLIKTFFTGW